MGGEHLTRLEAHKGSADFSGSGPDAFSALLRAVAREVSNKPGEAHRPVTPWTRPSMPPFEERGGEKMDVNSMPGTTGGGVPNAVQNRLKATGYPIFEDADHAYGSEQAVRAMENQCGWNVSTSNFNDLTCMQNVAFDSSPPSLPVGPELIDIVTPSIRDLDFLNRWREFFQGFHIIIVQDGDPSKLLRVPDWVDYELYNRDDIKKSLGKHQWIISSRDASIRNFGFLVSKKEFIYTIDDDCFPALDQYGFAINPIALHLRNLQTPATPYMFNTLYDPYVNGSDFVRGYPYSLRQGVPTAVSHGLWLNAPDYDAPTQLLKPQERNTNYADITVTVPLGILYPMCSMNVAFARQRIGPAFMQGLMGDDQPWARYDDMFAGWASKVVADHLGMGVKSGQPYIRHNKASNPFTNLKKEYKGLWWQERIIRFFMNVSFSTAVKTAGQAYRELAGQIEAHLLQVHPYFGRLASAMRTWILVWDKAANGTVVFNPSRSAQPGLPTLNVGSASRRPQ